MMYIVLPFVVVRLTTFLLVRLFLAFTSSRFPFATASIALPESTIHDMLPCVFGIGINVYSFSSLLLFHSTCALSLFSSLLHILQSSHLHSNLHFGCTCF